MDELDYALETVDGTTFETLSAAFLRALGYEVKESGPHGTDGGWDARISMNGRSGIAHASVRNDWRRKLRDDAEKVADLEADRGDDYDIFAFVTNQQVTGQQELDMEDEIEEEYGWKLKLYHRQNLLGVIHDENPELADRYLDVDLGFDADYLAELEDLRENRLDLIQDREGPAGVLNEGAAAVVHVIPNGISSTRPVRSTTDLPDPTVLGTFALTRPEARGKAKFAVDTYNRDGDLYKGYALLRNDGLYESVSTNVFLRRRDDLWAVTTHDRTGPCMDASILIAVRDALANQAEMGFSGAASVWVTFLDAAEAKLNYGTNLFHAAGGKPQFGFDRYTTEVATLSIGDHSFDEVIAELEPSLSELWLEFGYQTGCGMIEDGEWTGQGISTNTVKFP
ncbi:restriction endonuclease [Halomontanus rarus]|uniref:restriction endonuclease n=1 Tax=Halomontanus rarus TaxID=3034020 RepID=UPI001A988B0B